METVKQINFDVLNYITCVARKLESSKLSKTTLETVKGQTTKLAKFFGIDFQQCQIFVSIFVLFTRDNSCDNRDIIRFLEMRAADSLTLRKDINALIEKKIIEIDDNLFGGRRRRSTNSSSYVVREEVCNAIYENTPIVIREFEPLDIYGFCKQVSDLIEKREDDEMDSNELFLNVAFLEVKHPHLSAIEKLNQLLKIEDRTLLYEMCDDITSGGPYTAMMKTLNDIYDSPKYRIQKSRQLIEKRGLLFDLDLVSTSEARFVNDMILELTANAMDILLGEDAILFQKQKKVKNLIFSSDIRQKELYFDAKLKEDVDFLTEMLQPERFSAVKTRLEDAGLIAGVNVLLHGYPGTGKTELCYQLSQKSGRDIVQVDLSQTRNMFFGESEKRVKEIFQNYRRLADKCERAPILLINEADGLLSKRRENSMHSVDQTENTIQNILLEELERFNGIMICTSNLVKNLDDAFDRRFLFKIKFEKPSVEVKTAIWKNKLVWLDDKTAEKLATRFDFSGGEIDNITRKVITYEVLKGERPDTEKIIEFCESEKLSVRNRLTPVGFRA